jgi:hypothetical protein
MKTRSKHGRRKTEVSLIAMILAAGFVMTAWSMAISAGVIHPV